jgi:hypothetical protein
MQVNLAHLGLGIDSPAVSPRASNFRPSCWPPAEDFPVVIDSTGHVVSRYGDGIWNLRPWAKRPVILNFGDGPQRKGRPSVTTENAFLLRQVVAWWLYGPTPVRTPLTLRSKLSSVMPLFQLCSAKKILASDLHKYPAVADEYRRTITVSKGKGVLAIFHFLYEQREQIGFTLLNRKELSLMESALPGHQARQTPYIPPRIWIYQVVQLRKFLDDFHKHRDELEKCFRFCLGAYALNAGSLADACRVHRNKSWGPFWCHDRYTGARTGVKYQGPFIKTAAKFGISDLLKRWTEPPANSIESGELSIRSLATYFSMVTYVGIAYLLNFSLMRIDEAWSLRADCLLIEHDEQIGDVYILRGPTTKTIQDNQARWPTSPSVEVAVKAMACVARLRMICAQANPDVPTTQEEIRNPRLTARSYEPWGTASAVGLSESLAVKGHPRTYSQVFEQGFPSIFDTEQLRITQADLSLASLVNPTLDSEKFAIGKIWPLAWHQLRRTGAVNMQASGLVSEPSLQYLLKHASRAMSRYYGQGYSGVGLNNEAQSLFIRTMHEVIAQEIANLLSPRFVSPHGQKRKDEILAAVDAKDNSKLLQLAKLGQVSWRETLLGGCAKRGPCPYGGIDSVAHCGGINGRAACADLLYDRDKESELRELNSVIKDRLLGAPNGSPFQQSLEFQKRAVEDALNAIASF